MKMNENDDLPMKPSKNWGRKPPEKCTKWYPHSDVCCFI